MHGPRLLWRNYGVAVLSPALALGLARWPDAHLESAPVSLFLCAVMLSAWLGGVGPGLLATVLSAVAFAYYFVNPFFSLAVAEKEVPRRLPERRPTPQYPIAAARGGGAARDAGRARSGHSCHDDGRAGSLHRP